MRRRFPMFGLDSFSWRSPTRLQPTVLKMRQQMLQQQTGEPPMPSQMRLRWKEESPWMLGLPARTMS